MKSLKQILRMIPTAMAGAIFATVLMSWTYTYDNATPPDTGESPRLGASRIRELKNALQERLNVTGYYPYTDTEISDACAGENRRVLFHEPIETTPTVAENHGDLRLKDFDDKAELTWTDEDEHEAQLTSGGKLNGAILLADSVNEDAIRLNNDSYLTGRNFADDGDVNIFKVNTSDGITLGAVTTLPDTSALATSGPPVAAAQIANKKYVDDQLAAAVPDDDAFGSRASKSDDIAYKAASDGFVIAYQTSATASLYGYTDASNQPTTVANQFKKSGEEAPYILGNIMFPVIKGNYWKVTGSDIVYWLPVGG